MSAKRRQRAAAKKAQPIVQQKPVVEQKPATVQKPVTKTANDFLKTSTRKHVIKPNSTKRLRFVDEIDFINSFTESYITGKREKTDIQILADVKAYLSQKNGNPYNLKQKGPNAVVHEDMVHLCVDGEVVGSDRVKLEAKSISTNRVAYWNPVLAQQIIKAETDAAKRTKMEERLKTLRDLPHRAGYGH